MANGWCNLWSVREIIKMVYILVMPLFYYIQTIYGAYFLVHLNEVKVGSIEKIFHHVLCQKVRMRSKCIREKISKFTETTFKVY